VLVNESVSVEQTLQHGATYLFGVVPIAVWDELLIRMRAEKSKAADHRPNVSASLAVLCGIRAGSHPPVNATTRRQLVPGGESGKKSTQYSLVR